MKAYERFLKYVSFDTTSDPKSENVPSTEGQLLFAEALKEELLELGLERVLVSKDGFVTAHLPTNQSGTVKTIGFLAHMDTSPDCSGTNIKPRILRYEGGDIVLNEALGIVLKATEFPKVTDYIGHDIIVTDGTTLLGGDDKAGIAEIMTMLETLIGDPSIPRPNIAIAFTPDEEIGTGIRHFDVSAFGADFAYTVDGGDPSCIDYANFNAAAGTVLITGLGVHPGSAKGIMKNAGLIALEFASMLPSAERPEHTAEYEGFFHLHTMNGCVETAELEYLIRDHDEKKFERKKQLLTEIAQFLNQKYGEGTVAVTITDSYKNMKSLIEPHIHIIEIAKKAIEMTGAVPSAAPIRGGTDGSQLTYMGLPCPNLGTGGQNCHGPYELVSIEEMDRATEVLINICKVSVENIEA